jgi:branched-chain amino acid transport system substrate-binding protein
MRFTIALGSLAAATALWCMPAVAADEIVVGFATAASGFMQAYDKPAQDAALIRIDEINKAGGLLGKKLKPVFADTKTDQAEGAKAGLTVLDQNAELVIVSCDYDFGAPAALQAQSAGKVSFFLCAESIKAGIPGVGPYSFSASVLAAVQGATMAEWAFKKKNARSFYRLLDSWTVYNKGICDGFDWMMPRLKEATLAGSDTFKNDDASNRLSDHAHQKPAEGARRHHALHDDAGCRLGHQADPGCRYQVDDPQWLRCRWQLLAERRSRPVELLRAGTRVDLWR